MKKNWLKLVFLFSLLLVNFLLIYPQTTLQVSAEETQSQWDSTWHTSKDGLYSYFLSTDNKSAKIFYYEGPWNIKKLVIPAVIDGYKVTAIGNFSTLSKTFKAFHYVNDSVVEIAIPNTIRELDAGVFSGLEKLKKINLPNNLTEIPDDLFSGCISLQTVKLPTKLEKIGARAFSDTAIKEINLSDNITSIGEEAFSYCISLEKVTLPNHISSIKDRTFFVTSIKELNIPNSVLSIGDEAFSGCQQLNQITFSKNLTYIGYEALYNTAWLSAQEKRDYVMIDDILLKYNGTNTIPNLLEGTKSIAAGAFAATGITEIVIPSSVTSIGKYAFYNCNKLESIELPETIKKIESNAFSFTAISEISLPNSITSINSEAFFSCNELETIDFSTNLKYIGNDVFTDTPWLKSRENEKYLMINDNILLKYNGQSLKPVIPNGTINIAGGSFKGKPITFITIPASVKYIGPQAFYNTKLSGIYFYGDAPEVDGYAFANFDVYSDHDISYVNVYYKNGCIGYDTADWKIYRPSEFKLHSITFIEGKNAKKSTKMIYTGQKAEAFEVTKAGDTLIGWYEGDVKFNFNTIIDRDYILTARWSSDKSSGTSGDTVNSNTTDNIPVDSTTLENNVPTGVKINAINFPDFNFRSIVRDFDVNGNGYLSQEETDQVTAINYDWNQFYSTAINKTLSLTGIEYFTKLTALSVNSSKIKKLDLSKNNKLEILSAISCNFTSIDISGCKKLKTVYLDNSINLKVDFSNNTALKSLYCDNSTYRSLNLSENILLNTLSCSESNVLKFDLTKNINLEVLRCEASKLTSINLSKWGNLKELYCGSNKLKTLDISKNTKLKILDCNSNQLTKLVSGKASALVELHCDNNKFVTLPLGNLKALELLLCSGNIVNTLDISKNKNLKLLECQYMKLKSINLSNNSKLKEIWCNHNLLSELDLSKNNLLEYLDCSNNLLKSLDLSNNPLLDYLACSSNAIEILDFSMNPLLGSLDCSNNKIKTLNLSKTPILTTLLSTNNLLETLDVTVLPKLQFLDCTSNMLKTLDLSKNYSLGLLVTNDNLFQTLDVSQNSMLWKFKYDKVVKVTGWPK